MTTGQRIAELRNKKGFTQEDLADKMGVSRQTIYKWENDIVFPTKDKLKELVSLLDTSFDYLMKDDEDKEQVSEEKLSSKENDILTNGDGSKEEKASVPEPQPLTPLYTCKNCSKIIYDESDANKFTEKRTVRTGRHRYKNETIDFVLCSSCSAKKKKEEEEAKQKHLAAMRQKGESRRTKSFVFGILAALIVLAIGIYVAVNSVVLTGVLIATVGAVLTFTCISCLCLFNNAVVTVFFGVASWGFVKMPGVIFSFDLDGLAFLVVAKVILAILGFALAAFATVIAFGIAAIISPFVYPFALRRNTIDPGASWEMM